MPTSERVRRYETTGGAAGLVRVEVLVPPEDRGAILAAAARLRAAHRRASSGASHSGSSWGAEHEALYEEAVWRFGALCLWNAEPSRSLEGLRAVARRLKTYGGMDAWRHAERIEGAVAHAPG